MTWRCRRTEGVGRLGCCGTVAGYTPGERPLVLPPRTSIASSLVESLRLIASAAGLALIGYGLLEAYIRLLGRPILDQAFRDGWAAEARESRWLVIRVVSGSALALGVAVYAVSVVL